MKGKEKCKILKEIRAQIAAANDIAWVTENCTHKGDCRGTCPKCEAEVATLERALARRRALGKTVAVVGLSAGMIATTTACDALNDFGNAQLDGDMIAPSSSVSSTYALDGDIEIAGAPMPPVTTVEIPELGGEPLPVYYLTDFYLYDGERLFTAGQGFNLYDVVEAEKGPSGVVTSLSEGDDFVLIGHNGSEETEAWLYLVRYKGVLYAVDRYDLEHFSVEQVPVDE